MPYYGVSGEKKREIGNKKQPEAWVWASAVGGRAFLQRSLLILLTLIPAIFTVLEEVKCKAKAVETGGILVW